MTSWNLRGEVDFFIKRIKFVESVQQKAFERKRTVPLKGFFVLITDADTFKYLEKTAEKHPESKSSGRSRHGIL